MSDPKAIQRYGSGKTPVAQILTPQGPAIVQIIDMPPALASAAPAAGRRPGGIHILSAVLRRWWLVLLVTLLIGGGGFLAAGKFIQPVYDAVAVVRYHAMEPAGKSANPTDPQQIVLTNIHLLTKPELSLVAARSPELQQALPWLRGLDLNDPAVKRDVAVKLRDIVIGDMIPNTELVQISTQQPDAFAAAAVANAYADAFVQYCSDFIGGQDTNKRRRLEAEAEQHLAMLAELQKQKARLQTDNDVELNRQERFALMAQIGQIQQRKNEAEIKAIAAQAQIEKLTRNKNAPAGGGATAELERRKKIDEEKKADTILQAALAEKVAAFNALLAERAASKKDAHPDVQRAQARQVAAEQAVRDRENEIETAIQEKVFKDQELLRQSTLEQVQQAVEEARNLIKRYDEELARMNQAAQKLAIVQLKIQELDRNIAIYAKQYEDSWNLLQSWLRQANLGGADAIVQVVDRASVPPLPSADKRIKVQAASCVGGLFLGILLALLVDKFDKRLRDPREVEPMLNAPVLGTIPRIQELKRIRGDHARGLIAEEFRIIRTQVLFGNPDRQYKTICITSPAPGDGKTSLAVNLAIAIAKAGRRVLLIDGDLRKPDVHRIFNIGESPGLAELIQGSCEPAAAIHKSDIEMLDVLPAGLPVARPGELLSRPDARRLLVALAELYDHLIFDSAPLLPVSDTHVLVGMTDGVICSFNAGVDYDTIQLVEEILRRSHATVIGSVVNQVRYRQSGSYRAGKAAYDSYYNSPRTASPGADGTPVPDAPAAPDSA